MDVAASSPVLFDNSSEVFKLQTRIACCWRQLQLEGPGVEGDISFNEETVEVVLQLLAGWWLGMFGELLGRLNEL